MIRRSGVRSCLIGLLILVASHPGAAQSAAERDTTLSFLGFQPGASVAHLNHQLDSLHAGRLRCDHAKADPHVSECRALVTVAALGGPVNLWLSAMDSVAGVLTLSADVTPDQLDRWREALAGPYGAVDARVQGSQWMMQWVRRGRMVRLTWRSERGRRVASVSLVDGHVLDAWGRTRARARR